MEYSEKKKLIIIIFKEQIVYLASKKTFQRFKK